MQATETVTTPPNLVTALAALAQSGATVTLHLDCRTEPHTGVILAACEDTVVLRDHYWERCIPTACVASLRVEA